MSKPEAKFTKGQCPKCGSTDTKKMTLPFGLEEYIYCNACHALSVITQVEVNGSKNP